MFFSWKEKHNKYFICLLFHKNRNHRYIRKISKYLRKNSLLLRILTEPPWHQADKSKPLSVKAPADRSKISGEPAPISGKQSRHIFGPEEFIPTTFHARTQAPPCISVRGELLEHAVKWAKPVSRSYNESYLSLSSQSMPRLFLILQ